MSNTTPAPTDALLRCPFCGGAPTIKPSTQGPYASIVCPGPCGPLAIVIPNDQLKEGVAAWNRRAQPAASPAPVVAREPLTDGQCHALLEQMAEETDRWGEGLSYEPTKEQVSRFCVEFILRKIAPSIARVPFTKPQRNRLFHNRELANEKNMGVHLKLAEWHRIVQYIEAAHGITSKEGGTKC